MIFFIGVCAATNVVILQVHFGKITNSIRIKEYIRSLKRAVFFYIQIKLVLINTCKNIIEAVE
jgi:hypothetical protein